jgi:hypothetical protein
MRLFRPIGFDMEWRVTFRGPERRTALVQLCDERMILLIQVSAMKSEFSYSSCIQTTYLVKEFPQKVKVTS